MRDAFEVFTEALAPEIPGSPPIDVIRAVAENSSAVLYFLNLTDSRYEYVSPSVMQLTGLTAEYYP